jgi:AbrB family looped-hinge helix DNA binding protein
MNETTVTVDEKGRIIIPQKIRKTAKLKKGTQLNIKTHGKTIVMELMEPVADKYLGAFKINKWPENLDELPTEVIKKWWTTQAT